jgi:16S rRNA (cytidine1402-2'-O)-methyltransferase
MEKNVALYIVPTPIGNLGDITKRAIDVLSIADVILAEDTRHSLPMLEALGISKPQLISYHDHNEHQKAEKIIELINEGKMVALISDAGTPLISDPGYFLVSKCREAGVKVIPLPGACAAITALSASGLPTDAFVFEGFLPVKEKALYEKLKMHIKDKRTLIFYEAPRRILKTIKIIAELYKGRDVVIARELTKQFETFYSAKAENLESELLKDLNYEKGEMVLMIAPFKGEEELDKSMELLSVALKYLSHKDAVKMVSEFYGVKKNEIYDKALHILENTQE